MNGLSKRHKPCFHFAKTFVAIGDKVFIPLEVFMNRFHTPRWTWDEAFYNGLTRCPQCSATLGLEPEVIISSKQPVYCYVCGTESTTHIAVPCGVRLIVEDGLWPKSGLAAALRVGRASRRVR